MKMTTFVTALIDLEEKRPDGKDSNRYFELFNLLASTGIPLCVYISQKFDDKLKTISNKYSNVKIMKIVNLSDTWTYNIANKYKLNLPNNRCLIKDTNNYMIAINSKIEFSHNAIHNNPFNTNHFAWIDFGIFHVFHNHKSSTDMLVKISKQKLIDKLLVFPGVWSIESKHENYNLQFLIDNVNWRFCGGFFIGDKYSLLDMWKKYKNYFEKFISETNKIVWEVNIWTAMETFTDWSPKWYQASHDDSIIFLPDEYFVPWINIYWWIIVYIIIFIIVILLIIHILSQF
jgi:hypothetical protein